MIAGVRDWENEWFEGKMLSSGLRWEIHLGDLNFLKFLKEYMYIELSPEKGCLFNPLTIGIWQGNAGTKIP